MFTDSLLSCCLLLFASGCSIYLTGKWSIDNFLIIQPEIISASIGIIAINVRSTFNVISPFYFHATYSIDPLEVEDEDEETIESRTVPLFDKCCRVVSMVGLIYAMCEAHKSRKIGIIIISIMVYAETHHAVYTNYRKHPNDLLFHSLWMAGGAYIGWMKGNYYCTLSYIPYWIAFLEFPPEKNNIWSARRIINNYLMIAHMFLMLEAVRDARSLDS